MRVFLIFICGIALVSLAPEVHAGKHKDKKSGDNGAAAKSAQKAQAKSANWTKAPGVIVPSGMTSGGGVIGTTALCSSLQVGITGMRVGGIQPGATLRMRITPTTARSTAIIF